MRSRLIRRSLLMLAVLASVALAATGDARPVRQWAVVYLHQPTLIGSTIVEGPVLFIHDDARMARGEPCTTVQLFDPARGPIEEIAAFHCIPRSARARDTFTITTRPNTRMGYGCVLTEYQFAGDPEAHGVPTPADAH